MSSPPPATAPSAAPAASPLAGSAAAGRRRLGFWLYASHLFTLFGIALSNALAALTVLSLPWTAPRRRAAASPPLAVWAPAAALERPRRMLLGGLGFYTLFLGLSMALSYRPAVSVRATSELFTLATLPLGLLLARGERDVRRVVDGLVAVGALTALWGLGQYLAGYGPLDRRIRGPFSHWMTFSGFLLVCDVLLVSALLFGRRPGRRWRDRVWRWAALVAINAALLGSLTRSAWVALAVAVVAAVGARSPRLLALLPAAVVAIVVLTPVPVLARMLTIADLSDPSNYDRLCMADAGLRMIAERPLVGIGPDMVEERYPIYRAPTAPRYSVPHLHDSFLQLAAERGLPALAAYLAMLVASLAAAWAGFRSDGGRAGPRADLWLGALLALVAFNLAGLFENNWGDTEVQRLALFAMALPFCLAAGPPEGGEAVRG